MGSSLEQLPEELRREIATRLTSTACDALKVSAQFGSSKILGMATAVPGRGAAGKWTTANTQDPDKWFPEVLSSTCTIDPASPTEVRPAALALFTAMTTMHGQLPKEFDTTTGIAWLLHTGEGVSPKFLCITYRNKPKPVPSERPFRKKPAPPRWKMLIRGQNMLRTDRGEMRVEEERRNYDFLEPEPLEILRSKTTLVPVPIDMAHGSKDFSRPDARRSIKYLYDNDYDFTRLASHNNVKLQLYATEKMNPIYPISKKASYSLPR